MAREMPSQDEVPTLDEIMSTTGWEDRVAKARARRARILEMRGTAPAPPRKPLTEDGSPPLASTSSSDLEPLVLVRSDTVKDEERGGKAGIYVLSALVALISLGGAVVAWQTLLPTASETVLTDGATDRTQSTQLSRLPPAVTTDGPFGLMASLPDVLRVQVPQAYVPPTRTALPLFQEASLPQDPPLKPDLMLALGPSRQGGVENATAIRPTSPPLAGQIADEPFGPMVALPDALSVQVPRTATPPVQTALPLFREASLPLDPPLKPELLLALGPSTQTEAENPTAIRPTLPSPDGQIAAATLNSSSGALSLQSLIPNTASDPITFGTTGGPAIDDAPPQAPRQPIGERVARIEKASLASVAADDVYVSRFGVTPATVSAFVTAASLDRIDEVARYPSVLGTFQAPSLPDVPTVVPAPTETAPFSPASTREPNRLPGLGLEVRILSPRTAIQSQISDVRAALDLAGSSDGGTQSIDFTVRADHLRFYHAEDRSAAEQLGRALDVEARDMTSVATGLDPGRIEYWLSGRSGQSAPATRTASQTAVRASGTSQTSGGTCSRRNSLTGDVVRVPIVDGRCQWR